MKIRSISLPVISVFSIVLLLVVVLGLFSLWRLEDYHLIAADIRDRYLKNTQFLGDLNNFTSDFRAAEGTALLASTPSEIAASGKEVEQLDRLITLARHSYEHIRNDPDDTELYADFAAKWDAYRQLAQDVLSAAPGTEKASAIATYMTASRSAYDAASDALGVLTEHNRQAADAASLRADKAYRQARWLTTLAVLVAGLIVVGGLIHIRHRVLMPLLDLARRMRRLARNDMDVEVDGVERRDEIGEMARAVVVFRNNAVDLAVSQKSLAQQASLLGEKLAAEQRLTELQRNFISMASHEFRTPLTVIDGQAQRLINAGDRLAPGEVGERARKIRTAVARMTMVIDNLIDAARLFDGDVELYFHPAEFDMAELLHEVCHWHREVSPRAQIVERIPDRPLRVVGDRKLLFQALHNLVSNAVKYSPHGGIIRVDARSEADRVEITIADRGLGIPSRDRAHLFERYYRGSNVSGIVGTGIGLYLVKTVIDLHAGTIKVESREGERTEFHVSLPVAPAPRRAAAQDESKVAADMAESRQD